MLKIYGADLSSPANKVRFVANFLGQDHEYKRISLRDGEHRKPKFLAINPIGKIPVIDDNGFVLFESDAIIKYLASKQKSPIYPSELKARAIVDQWMDFVTIHIGGAMSKVLYNRVFAPVIKVEVDERSLKDGLSFLDRFLPVIENNLKKNKNLAGSEFSLADISLLANLDSAETAGIDLSKYPTIIKWRNELKQKDFYQKVHKEYGESLKQMAKA